ERELATASKHQAIAALKFLYAQVLPSIAVEADSFSRDCEAYQAPSVLTRAEISAVLARLSGIPRIVAMLLYGSGMRLSECLNLRIQDVNEREDTIYIRAAHGNDERVTLLPARIKTALVHHIRQTALVHQQDLLTPRGGWVALPTGITTQARSAGRHWLWQWVFPASRTHIHQPSQQCRRHHLSEHVIHLAVDEAAREAGITKQVSAHTLRHSFATHLLMHGSDMRSIQSLLGHKHLRTTTNYVRAAKLLRCRIRSPLDSFCDINGDSESE
ncbi:MAG TPA: integron integrase, partial [Sorangium sp.]|nr:integron integrase [Sorangium sp.]